MSEKAQKDHPVGKVYTQAVPVAGQRLYRSAVMAGSGVAVAIVFVPVAR